MRTGFLGLCFAFVAATASAADGGLVTAGDFHNVHMRVPEPKKASELYVETLGAKAGAAAHLIFLGKMLIEFLKDEAAKPSVRSAIDHFGLSYADLDAQM